jgi:hypothetical protein
MEQIQDKDKEYRYGLMAPYMKAGGVIIKPMGRVV